MTKLSAKQRLGALNKVTAVDVAERAGVSQSAVSRVFTPGASVSSQTKNKVLKVAMELGYRPNSLARAMVSGKSRMIGLVVAYLQNQFYPEAIEKLSKAMQERNYHLLVFMTSKTEGDVSDVMDEILDYQVDGIIAASVALSSDLSKRCASAGVPVVLFNRSQDDESLSSVTSENYQGGRKIADYLMATGHQRISYIAGWKGASTQRDRQAGFVDALQEAGVDLWSRGVGNFIMEDAQAAARAMFADGIENGPDAIFVANDHMAIAVMDTLRSELGIAVPDQVSVIGYDDVPAASWPSYDLTTVRQPTDQMVDATVDLLLAQIENPDPISSTASQIKIDGPLIIRGSARSLLTKEE